MTPSRPTSRKRSRLFANDYGCGGRIGKLRIRVTLFSKHHANTSRFSAPHTLGEEQPADYARDEVCGRGALAQGAGSGAGGEALCAGTGASVAFDDGAHSRAATSVAGAARREERTGDCADRGTRARRGI